jgi:AraC-like DNA-binding protein
LLVVLPPDQGTGPQVPLLQILDRARPLGILPFNPDTSPGDLAQVLRRQPSDLGAEVTEYLRWRGLGTDRETSQLIRRIIDLSAELRTISAVCRGLYISRRSLGRRLMCRGLPVPSHWLHIGRILRVALRLQNHDATISSVAFDMGYPDGFSVSNQMERLVGVRPSDVRGHLGWEWLFEAWLRREAERGGLAPIMMRGVRSDGRDERQIGTHAERARLKQTRRVPPVPTDN